MSRLTYRRGLIWSALGSTLMLAAAACSSSGSSSAAQSNGQPTVTASAPASLDLSHPTKALCKKSSYKIGYDVFSDSQPFAVSLSDGLKAAAASVGCAQVLETVDNQNGPVAIGNLHTLINEGINGFIDFQVPSQYQPAMSKILKSSKIPSVTVVG